MKKITKGEQYRIKALRFLRKYFPQQYFKLSDEEVVKLAARLRGEYNAGVRRASRWDEI